MTCKTVFLLLLALAGRRGDIHAFDPKKITFMDMSAVLEPIPLYLPKVKSMAEGEKRAEEFCLLSQMILRS